MLNDSILKMKGNFEKNRTTPVDRLKRMHEIKCMLESGTGCDNDSSLVACAYMKIDNKKIKKLRAELHKIINNIECVNIQEDYITYKEIEKLWDDYRCEENNYKWLDNYIIYQSDIVLQTLREDKFIIYDKSHCNLKDPGQSAVGKYRLTLLGVIASQIKEMHSLAFSKILIETNWLQDLDSIGIVGLLSCFTNVRVCDDAKQYNIGGNTYYLKNLIEDVRKKYDNYILIEEKHCMTLTETHDMHYDLINEMILWCECENEDDALEIINKTCIEKQIYLGDFVKAVIKINAMCVELKNICDIVGSQANELKLKLSNIPNMILKFIVTNQSIYLHI